MKLKNRLSKQETIDFISEIFSQNPSPEKIKKAKKLAASKNIKLRNLKERFCKKCYTLFNSDNSEIRINGKKKLKIIKCKNCEYVSRYRLKSSSV